MSTSDEEQSNASDTSQVSGPLGKPVSETDTYMSDQSGSELYQGHARSTCPSPEDREAIPCSSWDSGYAASDSPRSSASSHDQSRFFTNVSRSNYQQPQYETDDESEEVAEATDALRLFCISPATTGPGTTTKRKRVEVGSDESDRGQMEWPRKRGTGALSSQWPGNKRP